MASSTAKVLGWVGGILLVLGACGAGLGWYVWKKIEHLNINGDTAHFYKVDADRRARNLDPARSRAFATDWASRMQSCLPPSFKGSQRSEVQGLGAFVDGYRSLNAQELRWSYGQGADQVQVLAKVNLGVWPFDGVILPDSAMDLDPSRPGRGYFWPSREEGFKGVLLYGYRSAEKDPPLIHSERMGVPYNHFLRFRPMGSYDGSTLRPANLAVFAHAKNEGAVRDFMKTLDPDQIEQLLR